MIDTIPSGVLHDIFTYLNTRDFISFVKVVKIPRDIINVPDKNGMTVLEKVIIFINYYDEPELYNTFKKLKNEGANPRRRYNDYEHGLQPALNLYCDFRCNQISEEVFNKIYDILFPNELKFTRSGIRYSPYIIF